MTENENIQTADPEESKSEQKSDYKPEQSWEIVMDAFEQAYQISRGLEETELAEELLCNLGIARGNLALATQQQDYFQNYVKNVQCNTII